MAKLLMRVTGKREAGFDPSLQPLVQEPAAYLNASGLDREGRVVVRFNASLVEQALMSLNYPVWGVERPLTLLWIAADNGQGEREMLSANELASGLSPGMAMLLEDIQAQVLAVADERGLPIALPLLDVEDMTAVTFADVWGGFDEPVQRASVRYRPDAVLIVRVRPGAFGNEVQCLLLKGGGRNTLAGISLQHCLDAVADLYATEYSVIGGASSARLTVLDVATLGDYGRVVSYLETLTVLQSVDVESLERGVLTLRVAARGDAQVLERVLALGGVLAPAGDGVGVQSRERVDLSRGSSRRSMTLRWLPNAICILRLLLVVPVVLLLVKQQYAGALVLIVVAGVSDALDGYLAKTFDWRSRLGGLLDPLADKLLLVSVFLALTYAGLVPSAR